MTTHSKNFFNRFTLGALLIGAGLAAGVSTLAGAQGAAGWHHGAAMDGSHSAAEMSAHVDHMLKHFYVEINATDAQKAQIDPLVKQAMADLMPMHSQLRAAHGQALQALTQATVDRTALEAARLEHLQLADQASKRITQLIADVGDVLTPAQRSALGEHLQHMHVKTQS
jgi:periplasmic protein CpxP/Spy